MKNLLTILSALFIIPLIALSQPINTIENQEGISNRIGNYKTSILSVGNMTEWADSTKRTIEYNDSNQRLEFIQQIQTEGQWINSLRYSYNYNQSYQLEDVLVQNWVSEEWIGQTKNFYKYDNYGRRIEIYTQSFQSGEWVNGVKYLYTYNDSNLITSQTRQNWQSNNWVNAIKYSYTYNELNQTTGFMTQNWDGTDWKNYSIEVYEYNDLNNQTNHITQLWVSNSWYNYYRDTTIYNEDNRVSEVIAARFLANKWMPNSKDIYSYGNNHSFLSEIISQTCNTGDTVWNNNSKVTYNYSVDNYVSNIIVSVWNGEDWEYYYKSEFFYFFPFTSINRFEKKLWLNNDWQNQYRIEYDYGYSDIDYSFEDDNNLIENFPNPFSDETQITFNLSECSFVRLDVFDINGNKIANIVSDILGVGYHNYKLSGKDLPAGAYYYQLNDGKKIYTRNLMKVK